MSISIFSFADNNLYQYIDNNGSLVISNKPKISNTRYKILAEELTHEKQALIEAKQILINNPEDSKEKQLLNNTIKEHQKNIDILSKQLGYTP